jgi:hypothetical protein
VHFISCTMYCKSSLLRYAQDQRGTALSDGSRSDPLLTALTFGLHDRSERYYTRMSSFVCWFLPVSGHQIISSLCAVVKFTCFLLPQCLVYSSWYFWSLHNCSNKHHNTSSICANLGIFNVCALKTSFILTPDAINNHYWSLRFLVS